jgi:6-phosphofructokinase
MDKETVGVMVAGGPAPGINGVIQSVVHAAPKDYQVFGFFEGFKYLVSEDEDVKGTVLHASDVEGIHLMGGNILQQSRDNLLDEEGRPSEKKIRRAVDLLKAHGIKKIVTIGGDDTAYSAYLLSEGGISVVHVPKTIDNDLPLGNAEPTFGFRTAVDVASIKIKNLIRDAHATNRWHIVVIMGRSTGHLALESAVASGAHVVMIPEHYEDIRKSGSIYEAVFFILDGIQMRYESGFRHGVAVVAEGIAGMLDPEELSKIPGVKFKKDEVGNIRFSEIPFASILKDRLSTGRAITERLTTGFVADDIGYELRCADPNAFDIQYTRMLGHFAVKGLFDPYVLEKGGVMVFVDSGKVMFKSLRSILDISTGKIAVRRVDKKSALYMFAFGG